MKTPEELGREAANKFNANNPGHFPGRPLFEGVVATAVREARAELEAENKKLREACAYALRVFEGECISYGGVTHTQNVEYMLRALGGVSIVRWLEDVFLPARRRQEDDRRKEDQALREEASRWSQDRVDSWGY